MTNAKLEVSAELFAEMKQYLSYNPDTGLFKWIKQKKNAHNIKVGDIAGYIDSQGYVAIRTNGNQYKAHRLAWLFYYGYMPKDLIDHKNGIKSDNWIDNLREATSTQNQQNIMRANISGSSGFLGVSKRKDGVFVARIMVKRKSIHIGLYPTAIKAHEAYLEAKRKYHEFCTI